MERIDRFIYNAISHARTGNFVVAYDIAEDRERARVAGLLTGFGNRVQFSVFECRLTKRRYYEMLEQLDLLAVQTGFIRVYSLHASSKIRNFGKEPEDYIDPEGDCIVI